MKRKWIELGTAILVGAIAGIACSPFAIAVYGNGCKCASH